MTFQNLSVNENPFDIFLSEADTSSKRTITKNDTAAAAENPNIIGSSLRCKECLKMFKSEFLLLNHSCVLADLAEDLETECDVKNEPLDIMDEGVVSDPDVSNKQSNENSSDDDEYVETRESVQLDADPKPIVNCPNCKEVNIDYTFLNSHVCPMLSGDLEGEVTDGVTIISHEVRVKSEFPTKIPKTGVSAKQYASMINYFEFSKKFMNQLFIFSLQDLKHRCHKCPFSTNSRFNLTQHNFRHRLTTLENGLFYFCVKCEAGFGDPDLLGEHASECSEKKW